MGFTNGLELVNNELAFAEHQNVELMAARGNQRISGVDVAAQGTPDLTVAVASGNVLAGGVVVAVSAEATFAGTPNTFSTTQGNLTSGQAEFVFVHIDSSGVITNTEGGAAVAGQQLPPDVPEDEIVIAMITLTQGDTTIDSVDIEDWRINVSKGGYIAGSLEITGTLTSGTTTGIGIADNNFVRVDGTPVNTEVAKFTANGLQSTPIGISDNNMVEIDSADVASGRYARFTTNGLDGRTASEVLADILAAPIADPTFTGEIGIGSVNVSETELGILEGATVTTTELNILDGVVEGANKLQIGNILIQWGVATVTSGGEKDVTYPIAYTTTPALSLMRNGVGATSGDSASVSANSVTTTGFNLQSRRILDTGAGTTDVTDSNGEINWIAIGINNT